MKILVTGFDPFGGDPINPAFEAVRKLPKMIAGAEIEILEVPTVFHKSIQAVTEALDKGSFDAVLLVGQAGGRFALTPERVAINLDDARIKDNEGNQPIDVPVIPEGPAAYFSTLPIKAMVENIRKQGLPAKVSNTAGTFVCNHLMYGVLHHIAAKNLPLRGGFIHVPFLPEQVVERDNTPAMGLEDMAKGLEAAVEAMVLHKEDISVTGGAEF
ncbi:MAG TPA: pyroglutamyl-peptidase I [Synergistaceae bacterium]|nr:pyroglutamyl-peptidase I [Synergistaceae bacterium]